MRTVFCLVVCLPNDEPTSQHTNGIATQTALRRAGDDLQRRFGAYWHLEAALDEVDEDIDILTWAGAARLAFDGK